MSKADEMLNIISSKFLEITKIKSWAVYFDYDGDKYLLHCSDEDYESLTTLYRRKCLDNGKYELISLKSHYGNYIPSFYFKKGRPLKNIDKEWFIKYLTYYGFVTSYYDEETNKIKKQIKNLEIKQSEIQTNIREIKNKIDYEGRVI